jgi:tRNA(adenine34) deaminase
MTFEGSKNNDERFMSLAVEEAKQAKREGDLPFGAVVVRNGEVAGKGHTRDTITQDVTEHSELQALQRACKKLGTKDMKDCVIYCTNEPCMMCAAAIFQADIPRVVIGVSRDELSSILRPRKLRIDDLAGDSGYKIEIVRGVLKNEVLELFKDVKRK